MALLINPKLGSINFLLFLLLTHLFTVLIYFQITKLREIQLWSIIGNRKDKNCLGGGFSKHSFFSAPARHVVGDNFNRYDHERFKPFDHVRHSGFSRRFAIKCRSGEHETPASSPFVGGDLF